LWKDRVTVGELEELEIVLAEPELGPNKVIRFVKSKNAYFPASPAMAFVLRHRLPHPGMFDKIQSFDSVCELVAKGVKKG
jgi:hypothetical protein